MIGAISNWPISMPAQSTTANDGLWTRGLLIRRRIADGDLAFFTTWWPRQEQPSKNAGRGRRPSLGVEDSFETAAKTSFGLDHNESRSGTAGIATYLW